jgi:hypothetical protein
MRDHFNTRRDRSRAAVVSTRALELRPVSFDPAKGLEIIGPTSTPYAPTNWAFGQLCQLAKGPQEQAAPASYLHTLPSPIAADCLNYGLKFNREAGELLTLASA